MTLDEKVENVKVGRRTYNIGDYVLCEKVFLGGAWDEIEIRELYIGQIAKFYGRFSYNGEEVNLTAPDEFELANSYIISQLFVEPNGKKRENKSFLEETENGNFRFRDVKQKITKKRYQRLVDEEE